MEEITGTLTTVKLAELVVVPPVVVTEIGPVVAPTGTAAVIWPGETTVTAVAASPLNATVGTVVVALVRLLPLIVTISPTGPVVAVKLAMLGTATRVKLEELIAVPPVVVTVIGAVMALAGTGTDI